MEIIILYIIGAAVSVLILRVVFSIPEFLSLQKAQLKLLAKIAKQQGVSADEVEEIMNVASKSFFDKLK